MFDSVPEEVKKLSIAFSLSFFGSSMMWLFLPVFFRQHVESVFLVGVLTSIPGVATIILDIPAGNLVQRMDSKLVTFAGLSLFVLPGIFYFTTLTVMMFFGKLIEGISKTLRWESGWYIAMEDSREENESETLGVFTLGKSISDVIGPIVGGLIAFYLGFRYNLLLWSLFGVLSAVFVFKFMGFSMEGSKKAMRSLFQKRTYKDDFRHFRENWRDMKWPVSMILLHALVFSFFWVAIPLLLEDIGANYMVMGALFGIVALPRTFQAFFGKLADKFGWLRTVQTSSFLMIIVLFIMGMLENILLVGVMILLARLCLTSISPSLHSLFDDSVADEYEGEMVGFLEFFKHLGHTIGPFMAGSVASRWSISASFFSASGVAVILFLIVSYLRFSLDL